MQQAGKLRIILALLAAACVPAIGYYTILALFSDLENPFTAILVFFATFIIAFLHAVLLGLPYFLWLRKHGRVTWWTLLLGGFALGFLPSMILGYVLSPVHFPEIATDAFPRFLGLGWLDWLEILRPSLFMASCGAISALSAWVTWRFLPQKDSVIIKT